MLAVSRKGGLSMLRPGLEHAATGAASRGDAGNGRQWVPKCCQLMAHMAVAGCGRLPPRLPTSMTTIHH